MCKVAGCGVNHSPASEWSHTSTIYAFMAWKRKILLLFFFNNSCLLICFSPHSFLSHLMRNCLIRGDCTLSVCSGEAGYVSAEYVFYFAFNDAVSILDCMASNTVTDE